MIVGDPHRVSQSPRETAGDRKGTCASRGPASNARRNLLASPPRAWSTRPHSLPAASSAARTDLAGATAGGTPLDLLGLGLPRAVAIGAGAALRLDTLSTATPAGPPHAPLARATARLTTLVTGQGRALTGPHAHHATSLGVLRAAAATPRAGGVRSGAARPRAASPPPVDESPCRDQALSGATAARDFAARHMSRSTAGGTPFVASRKDEEREHHGKKRSAGG